MLREQGALDPARLAEAMVAIDAEDGAIDGKSSLSRAPDDGRQGDAPAAPKRTRRR